MLAVVSFLRRNFNEMESRQLKLEGSIRGLKQHNALYHHTFGTLHTELAIQSAATSDRVNALIKKTDANIPALPASIPPYPPRTPYGSDRPDPFKEDPNLVPFDGHGFPVLSEDEADHYRHNFHVTDPRAKLPGYPGDLCAYRHPESGCADCYMVRHVADVKDMISRFKTKNGRSLVELVQWPVIRNSSTTKYHLLGRPEIQFVIPEFMIPPGCMKEGFGRSTEHAFKPANPLPDLEGTKMPFVLKIKNGILNSRGTVYVKEHEATIVGASCLVAEPDQTKHGVPTATYDRVLALSQFWGYGPFHWLVECLPRLMTVSHLLKDPNVMIHVPLIYDQVSGTYEHTVPPVVKSSLEFLGVPRERIVFGEIMGKEVIFPPQGTCQYSDPIRAPWLGAFLQHLLRQRAGDRMLPATTHPSEGKGHVLFIKRTGKRSLVQHEKFVEKVMDKFPGHKMAVFADNPPPSFEEIMLMFYNADVIAGPHGAGEANMLVSRPGTRIFEWKMNDFWVGSCFQLLAWSLGHNWWSYAPLNNDREAPVSVTDHEIEIAANRIRGMWENESLRVIDTR